MFKTVTIYILPVMGVIVTKHVVHLQRKNFIFLYMKIMTYNLYVYNVHICISPMLKQSWLNVLHSIYFNEYVQIYVYCKLVP